MTQPSKRPDVHPIGYVEFQTGWVGHKTPAEIETIIAELRAKIAREAPGLVESQGLGRGPRVEHVADGNGVIHFTMYIGVEPPVPAAPPLGNNMNDAPLPQPGFGPAVEDTSMPIGYKEEKFGRGT